MVRNNLIHVQEADYMWSFQLSSTRLTELKHIWLHERLQPGLKLNDVCPRHFWYYPKSFLRISMDFSASWNDYMARIPARAEFQTGRKTFHVINPLRRRIRTSWKLKYYGVYWGLETEYYSCFLCATCLTLVCRCWYKIPNTFSTTLHFL